MSEEPHVGAQLPRRGVLRSGGAVALGISSLSLPAAAVHASPGGGSTPPQSPQVTATYNPATDTLTVVGTRTDNTSEAEDQAAIVRRWPDGGSRTTSKYDSLVNSDPKFVWAAGSYTVTRALSRQLLGGPPSEDDAFSVYLRAPGDAGVETASDVDDRATYTAYTNLPTVHLSTLKNAAGMISRSARGDLSIEVTVTPDANAEVDLVVLRGAGDVADWVPSAFSLTILDGATELGTLDYATDDGELAVTLRTDTPISLTSGTAYTFRIDSATAAGTEGNNQISTTQTDDVGGWTQSASSGYYLRWSIGRTSSA